MICLEKVYLLEEISEPNLYAWILDHSILLFVRGKVRRRVLNVSSLTLLNDSFNFICIFSSSSLSASRKKQTKLS